MEIKRKSHWKSQCLITREATTTTVTLQTRFVTTEGEDDTNKGMKWEWATVNNDVPYIGSMGKEYTNPNGSITSTNNLNGKGEVEREDWKKQCNFV